MKYRFEYDMQVKEYICVEARSLKEASDLANKKHEEETIHGFTSPLIFVKTLYQRLFSENGIRTK